ncbi:MAG TPA: maleylacetoacetate isomerase [Alphaproteobacteria bacterium]|nr:maleylacetoacetate isomerase [Alphaproteobacteria bacterium]
MKLHGYFRSSAAFRVRIALNLKGLEYASAFRHLRKGEQNAADYRQLNPQGLVPTLEDGAVVLTQSLAIIEYLEETHPLPPLLPKTPAERARVRALALAVACDIHPLNNLRVLQYLKNVLNVTAAQHDDWYRHWIAVGLAALEEMLRHPGAGRFCHGDQPGLADLCLVPQIFNAKRLDSPLEPYPTVMRIFTTCMTLSAFERARPENQPDAE